MIEVIFAVRKDKFCNYPAVIKGLDLIQEDDQIIHLIKLDEEGLEGKELLSHLK
jgi:pre-mRNA-splicing factor CWC22